MVSEHHTMIHSAFELKASTLLKLMNNCDAWRKPQRFLQMLECCIADSKGRTGFEDRPYPTADYVWQAFQAALTVDVQDIIKQGVTGAQIKEALLSARIDAVKVYKEKAMSHLAS